MAGNHIEFAQFGHFDSFDIIRSVSSMANVADVDLPSPIVTGLKTMYYVDSDVVEGLTYYYKVRVWLGSISFVSDEVAGYAGSEVFLATDLLIIADSNEIRDISKNNRTITVKGNVQYVDSTINTPLYSNGSYYFDGSGDALDIDISTMGLNDFTFEMWAKILAPNSGKSWHRYFDLGDASGAHAFSITNNATDSPQRPQMYAYNTSNVWQQLITPNKTIQFNQYKHICLMRKNGVFYLLVHGELSGSNANNIALNISKNRLRIGADLANTTASASESKMYLDSFRVVKKAIYPTTGFIPPSSKFETV
ncbi:LamG-like jellyroll fold domain-containing protein [Acinetobacter lwoffii]|uniref:LamG-like jellyroll fold domain-containing protein n=1 Tax=Acinetobacter lwoffii TaxID=28090 RepID=UPI003F8D349D